MRKIRQGQGVALACYHDGFHDLGTFDTAPGTVQSPGVCADAQCCKITWLEELASESNTIQAQRYICVREDCRQYQGETIYGKVVFDCPYLWIAQFVWARVLCVHSEYESASLDCSGVIQKIHRRKIRLTRVSRISWKLTYFMLRGR